MQNLIGIILQVVLLLWKHKGKTTFAAVLAAATGGGTYAWLESQRPEPEVMAFHGSPGVPSTGPSDFPSGSVTNMPGEADEVLTSNGDGSFEFTAGGGGGASDLVDLGDITNVETATDGHVLTANGDDTFTFKEVVGGGGDVSGLAVIDVRDYNAAGQHLQATVSVNSASTSATLSAATGWSVDDYCVIRGAGASHAIGAPASAPMVGNGGTSGATTYTYGVGTFTGNGGWSAVSSTTANTTGNATLSATNYNTICWPTVASNNGFFITGRGASNRVVIACVNGATTCYQLTFQAGGYTNAVQTDIGRVVVTGSHDGRLLAYDNTSRIWYVRPTVYGSDTYPSGAVTITGGTGAGTLSGAGVGAHYWQDTGDATDETIAPHRSYSRRASDEFRTGDWILHPFDNTGVWYVCCRTRTAASGTDDFVPKTSSTANGSVSLTNTIGVETRDGDIYWRREEPLRPTLEPSSAVPDALFTQITALAGTAATLNDAAGNTVSSQAILHNDLPAIQAAHTALMVSGVATDTLYFPAGEYPCITPDMDASGSPFSEINSTTEYLFYGQSSDQRPRRWLLDTAATINWNPLSVFAASTDLNDSYAWFVFATCNGFSMEGSGSGQFNYRPISEPILESNDGWNEMRAYIEHVGGEGSYTRDLKFANLQLLGWSWFGSETGDRSYGDETVFDRVYAEHGGADHDAFLYCDGVNFDHVTYIGTQFDGSDVIYTDEVGSSSEPQPICQVTNSLFYRGRKEFIRLRSDNGVIVDNTFILCDHLLMDSVSNANISGNVFDRKCRFTVSGTGITLTGNRFKNAVMQVTASQVNISGGSFQHDGNADTYHQPAAYILTILGGTGINVTGTSIINTDTGADRGIMVSGGTDINFTGVTVDVVDEKALDVTTAFSGTMNWTGGLIDTNGFAGINLIQNASAIVTMTGTTIRSSGGGDIEANNGTLMLKGVTSYINFDDTTGLDSLSIDGCEINKGVSGTTAIACPNSSITNTTFGSNPVMTGLVAGSLSIGGNRITTSRSQTMTALAANTDNMLVGVCDTLALTTSGTASYDLTGLLGLQEGNQVTLVNAESSGADVITLVHASTSAAGNQFFLAGATNYAMDPGDWITVQVITGGGATYYREVARGP